MKPTEVLIAEHNAVLTALQILEKAAAAPPESQASEHLEQLVDFFRGFVDRCHHGKEEIALFPELERRGVAREGGPIGVMLMEHEKGREYVRAIADELDRMRHGDAGATGRIREQAGAYCELLQAHIDKENSVLFPIADRLVPEDIAEQLAGQFEEIERTRVGEGKHEAYHAMLHALKKHYGVA